MVSVNPMSDKKGKRTGDRKIRLIVNLGPAGDALRTTVLLTVLDGDIYWLTKTECAGVLNSPRTVVPTDPHFR